MNILLKWSKMDGFGPPPFQETSIFWWKNNKLNIPMNYKHHCFFKMYSYPLANIQKAIVYGPVEIVDIYPLTKCWCSHPFLGLFTRPGNSNTMKRSDIFFALGLPGCRSRAKRHQRGALGGRHDPHAQGLGRVWSCRETWNLRGFSYSASW